MLSVPATHGLYGAADSLSALRFQGGLPEANDADKLIQHKHYIDKHGQDLREIRNWKWKTLPQ